MEAGFELSIETSFLIRFSGHCMVHIVHIYQLINVKKKKKVYTRVWMWIRPPKQLNILKGLTFKVVPYTVP